VAALVDRTVGAFGRLDTKHGVLGMTKSAALEYAPRGIRINAVCPGTIETPMVARMIADGELSVDDAVAGQPIGRSGAAPRSPPRSCGYAAPERASSSASRCPSTAATPPADTSTVTTTATPRHVARQLQHTRPGATVP